MSRRGDAVRLFLRTVGMPAAMVPLMRLMPPWKQLVGVAHTLPFDLSLVIGHQQGQALPVAEGKGRCSPVPASHRFAVHARGGGPVDV